MATPETEMVFWVIMRRRRPPLDMYVYGPYRLEEARADYDRRVDLWGGNDKTYHIRIVKEIDAT